MAPEAKATISAKDFSTTEPLPRYHRLRGAGKTKLFFESSERSMCYLTDCLGHNDLAVIEMSDAGPDLLVKRRQLVVVFTIINYLND